MKVRRFLARERFRKVLNLNLNGSKTTHTVHSGQGMNNLLKPTMIETKNILNTMLGHRESKLK